MYAIRIFDTTKNAFLGYVGGGRETGLVANLALACDFPDRAAAVAWVAAVAATGGYGLETGAREAVILATD